MDIEENLQEEFDEDVTVERTTNTTGREATAAFTIYCDADSTEEIRERLAELETDVAFETMQQHR